MRLQIYEIYDSDLLIKNGSSVQEVDFSFGNKADFKMLEKTIDFEGDESTNKVYIMTGADVELHGDTWDLEGLEDVLAKAVVTSGLPAGTEKRWYFGPDDAGVRCGLSAKARAIDLDTNSKVNVRVVVPIGSLSAPNPPSLSTGAKAPLMLRLSAVKTGVDIAGNALPGVPSGGVFWYLDKLS